MKQNKNYANQIRTNAQVIFFWAVIALITTIYIILLIINLPARKIKSLDEIKHLVRSEIFLQELNSDPTAEYTMYYVYVYESSKQNQPGKNSEIREVVLNYANYVKANSKKKYYKNLIIPNIYCFDVDYASHADIRSTVNAPNGTNKFSEFTVDMTSLPALVIIYNWAINHPDQASEGFITRQQDIEKTLSQKMNEIEEAVKNLREPVSRNLVAILDKKEFLV